jgi:hypothetical protein
MSNVTGTPAPTPQEGKSRSWLVIVIVVVVICCLAAACLGAGYYFWTNGDRLFNVSALLGAMAAL